MANALIPDSGRSDRRRSAIRFGSTAWDRIRRGPGRNGAPGLGEPAPAAAAMTPGSVVPLGRASRRARWAAAAVGLFLLTAGTLVGTDDDFPLGPLRMYAVRDDPNGTVTEAVVLARTEPGRLKDVTDTAGAPRRAELEGRFGELSGDPARFAPIARSFEPRSGLVDGRAVTTIILVRRSYPLHDGRSGPAQDRVVATWTVPR